MSYLCVIWCSIVLYVCFETCIYMRPSHIAPWMYMDLLISYGLLSPLKLSRNALPSICSVHLVLSSHDFKLIHGDFMYFSVFLLYFCLAIPCI